MSNYIGIDLGTTYSAVATIDATGIPKIIENNGKSITPSCVMLENDKLIVGEIPETRYGMRGFDVGARFKRHMGEEHTTQLGSRSFTPTDLSAAVLKEMLNIAARSKPPFICIVPEKRKEITTEGGLNLNHKNDFLKKLIKKLKKKKSRISLFIEPSLKDLYQAKKLNADCVELHTGKLCNLINKKKNYKKEIKRIQKAVYLGNELGLEIHAGHGLTFDSAKILRKIKGIQEYNIGHFLIGESIFQGMSSTIKKFKRILKS